MVLSEADRTACGMAALKAARELDAMHLLNKVAVFLMLDCLMRMEEGRHHGQEYLNERGKTYLKVYLRLDPPHE